MHLFFSVGEPSGDHHAAELMQQLRSRMEDVRGTGYGGPVMRQAGIHLDYELTNLSVMGVAAVIPLLGEFSRLYRQARSLLARQRPDAVVLIDFPGFNWWIAKAARRAGIPVIYYMPPQLWAWASWRIRKMRRWVDLVLSPLPFETRWFRERGVDARYVGHPFLDAPSHAPRPSLVSDSPAMADSKSYRNPEFSEGRPIALLPGSRRQEVSRNFPVMLEVVRRLTCRFPEAVFHVACYKESHLQLCRSLLTRHRARLPLRLHVGRTSEIIEQCEMALTVSGSVSLELLAQGTPAVVLYQCGLITAAVGSILVRCPYITLPNLLAGREVMPEFVFYGRQQRHAAGMAEHLAGWLDDPTALDTARRDLQALRESLRVPGSSSAASRAAEEVMGFLGVEQSAACRSDVPTERRAA